MVSRLFSTSFALILFFLLVLASLQSREIPLPSEEAPTALFETEIRDAEVDFFIQGSWTVNLGGGFGLTWGDTVKGVQPSVLPDFTDGLFFQQIPQIDLSLWYDNRYFFEASITQDQTLETFLFGYYGEEEELVRELRIGNTDIGSGDFGTFTLPAASKNSLGAYSLLGTESTEHRLAVRYDPASSEELHYRGKNQIEEERIAPEFYIRGQFFILPDEDVENLKVYIRDDDGATADSLGRRYRLMDSSEGAASASQGLVYLKEPAKAEVVVQYEKPAGVFVGDASLGANALCGTTSDRLDLSAPARDFNFDVTDDYLGLNLGTLERTIEGNPALLLYAPGQWSPFELQSVYTSPLAGNASSLKLRLVEKENTDGTSLPLSDFEDSGQFRISPLSADIRSHEARYPLLSADFGYAEAAEIYGPDAPGNTTPVERELLLEKLTPVSSYNLGSEALEGSIEVLRNGIPTGNYSFNPDTGEINFFLPPASGERIDISFRSATAQAVGGDILAASSNIFRFNEKWSANLNLGLRWNADPNAYITEQGESEGSILGTGELKYESENFSFQIEGGLDLSSPNTTGRLRLFGMDDTALSLVPGPENLYPGAPSDTEYSSGGLVLTKDTRGKLYYKDFFNYSFAGGYSLMHYSWDPPGDQVYPYADGGRIGPYVAATGTETDGDAMVLEYKLADYEWVAGTIPISDGDGAKDLSHARAITLLVKPLGRDGSAPPSNITVSLAIGRLAEDLDSDGILDEEDSPYDEGFSFDLYSGGEVPVSPALPWAPQESAVNSEDLDGNGVLEGSVAAIAEPLVIDVSADTVFDPANTSWQRIIIPLDSVDRQKLQAVTGLEIFIQESSGTAAEGRLLIADIDLQGTPFTGTTEQDTQLDVFTRALNPFSSEHDALMSLVEANLLNGDSTYDTKVLKIQWADPTIDDTWEATGFMRPANLGDYESLSFFMKTGANPPDSLTLRLQNSQGEGLAVEFSPPADVDWTRYTWHLDAKADAGRIIYGETELNAADVSESVLSGKNRNALNVNRIAMEGSIPNGSGAGSIEIDEIYLHDPRIGLGGGGRSEVSYSVPGTIVSLGEVPLLGDLNFHQNVYAKQDAYAGGIVPAPAGNFAFTNQVEFSVWNARTSVQYNGRWTDSVYLPSGGYSITLPFLKEQFQVTDRYFEEHRYDDDVNVGREASAALQLENGATASLDATLDWDGSDLNREWHIDGRIGKREGLSVSFRSALTAKNDEKTLVEGSGGTIFERYAESTSLLSPLHTDGPRFRQEVHQLQLDLAKDRFSFGLVPTLSSQTYPAELPFSLGNANGISLNMGFSLGDENRNLGSLNFSYQRNADFRMAYDETSDFWRDFKTSLNRIPELPLVWTAIPITELWQEDVRDTFTAYSQSAQTASYSSASSISYKNRPGSRLSALLLPTELGFDIGRNIVRNLDSIEDTISMSAVYRSTALNLFGSLGRYPIFQWYRTEEISHRFSYEGNIPLLDSTEQKHTIGLDQYISISLNARASIGSDNSWKKDFYEDDTAVSSGSFFEYRKFVDWDIPYQEQLQVEQQILVHREEVDVSWEQEGAGNVQFSIIGGHSSELRLQETGFARVFGRIGYQKANTVNDSAILSRHTISIEIGMEVELNF